MTASGSRSTGRPQALPLVTIVVPCRNEARRLHLSLGSAIGQDYPPDRLEIIVADAMSEDGSAEVAREILSGTSVHWEVVPNLERNTPAALNLCIERAQGDVILYLIAHCELAPDYVRRCVEILEKTGADLVGGTIETRGDTPSGRAIALALSSRFGVGDVAFRTRAGQSGFVDTVALGAYRRDVFDRFGLFDPAFIRNQDAELSFRITRGGGRIWMDRTLHSVYRSRGTFGALWRQYLHTGASKIRILIKHGRLPAWRHYVPAAFVAALAVSVAGGILLRRPVIALAVLVPYVAAVTIASGWAARKQPQLWPLVAIAMVTLHLSYGVGSLLGTRELARRSRLGR